MLLNIFRAFTFSETASIPFISGLFEITIGSDLISRVKESTLFQQAILTSFILGFGGFSIQAQVASILAQTDIRFKPFFIARIFHGIFAAVITIFIWEPVYIKLRESFNPSVTLPVFGQDQQGILEYLYHWSVQLGPLITITSLIIYILIIRDPYFPIKKIDASLASIFPYIYYIFHLMLFRLQVEQVQIWSLYTSQPPLQCSSLERNTDYSS